MASPTITSANAKLTLTARSSAGIVVGPFTVQGYAEDAMFGVEAVDSAQAIMGADGQLSGGFLPQPVKFSISLMPNSPSVDLFDAWNGAQKALGDVLVADGFVSAPSLGKAYALVKGFMTRLTPIPAAGKTFSQPQVFEFTFESATPAPVTV